MTLIVREWDAVYAAGCMVRSVDAQGRDRNLIRWPGLRETDSG